MATNRGRKVGNRATTTATPLGPRKIRVQKGADPDSKFVLDRQMAKERLVFGSREARDLAARADRLGAKLRREALDGR